MNKLDKDKFTRKLKVYHLIFWKYKLLALLVIMLCCACLENTKTQSNTTSQYLSIINQLSDQGNWSEAIEIIKINLSPDDHIDLKDKINLYLMLGKNYRFLEEYQKSEDNFKKVIGYSPLGVYKDFLGEAYYGLGDLNYLKWSYFKQNEKLDISKEYLDSAMVYAKRNLNLKLQSKILYRQGTIYQIQGNQEESKKRFDKGLEISFSIRDTVGIIRNNTHLAAGYKNTGKLDSALLHYNRAYQHAKAINRNYSEAHALCNLGLYYLDGGEISQAKEYFDQAKFISEELSHRIILCRSYYGLSMVEEQLGNQTEALKYASDGLILAREKGYINFEQTFTKLIASLNKN